MSSPAAQTPANAAKRPYRTPELRDLGSLATVTATNPDPSGGASDGPNYVS